MWNETFVIFNVILNQIHQLSECWSVFLVVGVTQVSLIGYGHSG